MIEKYGEELIKELLKIDSFTKLERELMDIYPDGFDMKVLDERIRKRLLELSEKYNSIQEPIQERKTK